MGGWSDDEVSIIGDKGEVRFIDFNAENSTQAYDPSGEGPVVVSSPFPLTGGKPHSVVVDETAATSITIVNTTEEAVDLWSVKIYASHPEDSFTLSLMEPPSSDDDIEAVRGFLGSFCLEDRVLQPGQTLTVWLSCKPKEIGLHTSVVHFDIGDDRIERVVFLLADDKISQSLVSCKPFQKVNKMKQFPTDTFVAGKRPSKQTTETRHTTPRDNKRRLSMYNIPKNLRDSIKNGEIPEILNEPLSSNNYSSYFRTLLIMEEIKMEEDMGAYDMNNINMKKHGMQYLSLVVPGLAERRPSLVRGDYVFAKPIGDNIDESCKPYQGFVHRVDSDSVLLKFDTELHLAHRDPDLYNVQFTYNRINMRRQYQGIELTYKFNRKTLFPSPAASRPRSIKTRPLSPLSPVLNEEQMTAVEKVVGCSGGPPYVIHGPPGTGKTMTLVESVLQVYSLWKDTRILICTPSNSSADLVLENLISNPTVPLPHNHLFRLNAPSRSYDDLPSHIAPFSFAEDLVFSCPPLDTLLSFRIVVSTFMSAALLYVEGVSRTHFSHLFLDEAGQASEPETMIPIGHLTTPHTVLVLAGDPMQLGPIVFSKLADSHGLGKSFLQRLFLYAFYSDSDPNYVTKLVRNYRCHPEILKLPSQLFYGGDLLACRPLSHDSWKTALFPVPDFPLLFVGIQGCDEREGNDPSWFNRTEASKVVDIITRLTRSDHDPDRVGSVPETDIGVITPYRQQVLKIRRILEEMGMYEIKVGSVEQFQGQEKQVIIVSTVRSTIKHSDFDKMYYLGFLTNPRRFNVSVTRAGAGLIVVGNPHIISKDLYWNRLLWHCVDHGSYQGCTPPEREESGAGDGSGRRHQNEEDGRRKAHGKFKNVPENEPRYENETEPEYGHEPEKEPEKGETATWDEKPLVDEAEWSDGWCD